MKYLSVSQMREADKRAIEILGIPSVVLMENAGRAVFDHIGKGPLGIFCGKGNNGGDGFVVARHALLAGLETHVWLTHSPEECTVDSRKFLDAFQNLGGKLSIVSSSNPDAALKLAADSCDVLIDALLGTGCKGEIRGICRSLIDDWPSIQTISVDIPSGLDGDSGEPCGNAIKANTTVTFQFAKKGFLSPTSKAYTGNIIVADIGIPTICGDDIAFAEHISKTTKDQ